MKEPEKVIRQHLENPDARTMQLATVSGDTPWICTVWFVADDDFNLYWLSLPNRRHSRELAQNPKAAAAIVLKADMPTVGLQIPGTVAEVTDAAMVQRIMTQYVKKYGEGKFFYDRLLEGKNKHTMYRLVPDAVILTDGVNFPDSEKVAWIPSASKSEESSV